MRHDDDRQPQLVAQPQQQREDLAAHGRVQRRHRFVGDDHVRLQHERPRDDHALALTAGQLVRVAQEEALRRSQPSAGQRVGDAVALVARHAVDAQTLGDGLVDRVPRVQRPRRVLQDQLDAAAVGPQPGRGVRQRAARGARRRRWSARPGRGSPARAMSCRSRTRRPAPGSRPDGPPARPRRPRAPAAARARRTSRRGRAPPAPGGRPAAGFASAMLAPDAVLAAHEDARRSTLRPRGHQHRFVDGRAPVRDGRAARVERAPGTAAWWGRAGRRAGPAARAATPGRRSSGTPRSARGCTGAPGRRRCGPPGLPRRSGPRT